MTDTETERDPNPPATTSPAQRDESSHDAGPGAAEQSDQNGEDAPAVVVTPESGEDEPGDAR